MAGVRRAFLLNAGERYAVLAVQFILLAVLSRLLTPAEVGVSVIGTGIMTIALSLREFATAEFLVQCRTVTRTDVRTSFTVLMILNGMIAAGLFLLAPRFAGFYGEPALARFLHVAAFACLIEGASQPIMALLRRDMAFGRLAVINMAGAATNAVVAVGLASLGFSAMSMAWAILAASSVATPLSFCFRPDFWMLRPSLAAWRQALTFGGFNGATIVLTRIYDSLPQLVLGRFLPLAMVGLYNRASMVCGIPDRIFLSGVYTVAYPAFAAVARQGLGLKPLYLRSLSYITVLYWPAQMVLAVLAHPIIALMLGDQWISIVPLVQIMCSASLFWFPMILTYPVLVSLGAIRENLMAKVVCFAFSGPVLCLASTFGLQAMALSQFLTLPFQMVVALYFVRRHVRFAWGEIPAAIGASAAVTIGTAAGPAAIVAWAGSGAALGIGGLAAAIGLAAAGWVGGLVLTGHPFLGEIRKTAAVIGRFAPVRLPRPDPVRRPSP